jgi:restriction system protein
MDTQNDKLIWGIHAGKTGDADNLFLKHSVIALGWVEMGDMSKLAADREAFKVQVKSTEGSIGDPIVSQLYGKVERSEYGMVVTLGTFTNQAQNFARNKSNLRLIDGEELVGLVLQHYEQFDSKYKGLLPLKRVYVPEPLEETEG